MRSSGHADILQLFAAQAASQLRPPATDHDLNGTWQCDDGGRYFVRQIGPDLLWYGEAAEGQPYFANVAHGRLEHGCARLTWADVPKGPAVACGALVLRVMEGRMEAVRMTGGFGGSVWERS